MWYIAGPMGESTMEPNRLADEKSPYLLQHARNPVRWYPWSEDAFLRARNEDKPIFLSIGYATCHWCHVMERESFEDREAADILNDVFVCIKVDREERPDIDAVYMGACQMLTGSGGWPLTIVMTPERKPFFAGTYLPKHSRHGRIGLLDLAKRIRALWHSEREKVLTSAHRITGELGRLSEYSSEGKLDAAVFNLAYEQIRQSFDDRFGGFESAPKFPTPHRLRFLLRHHSNTGDPLPLEMARKTLTAMVRGGIWDHVGFGFHRYSTDRRWLLPHFEKMLYDQALIAPALLETYQLTGETRFARVAEDIFSYLHRDMTSLDGAFFSAEDADSEGEEGKFYVWTTDEFEDALGKQEAGFWGRIYNLEREGNFTDESTGRTTGANILHLTRPLSRWAADLEIPDQELSCRWEKAREKLHLARSKRVPPLKDDKILADWNGLMIAALAMGARILNRPTYARQASQAAQFIISRMTDQHGALWHRYRDGDVRISAHASDYAFLIHGLLSLYDTTQDLTHAEGAALLQDRMVSEYWDADAGGFFSTAGSSKDLPLRPKELYDGAIPSANSVALGNLLALGRLTGNARWEDMAHTLSESFSGTVGRQPTAYTHFLLGLDMALYPGQEVVIVGERDAAYTREMLSAIHSRFSPNRVLLLKSDDNQDRLAAFADHTREMRQSNSRPTAYVCSNFTCQTPTTDIQAMVDHLDALPTDPTP